MTMVDGKGAFLRLTERPNRIKMAQEQNLALRLPVGHRIMVAQLRLGMGHHQIATRLNKSVGNFTAHGIDSGLIIGGRVLINPLLQ